MPLLPALVLLPPPAKQRQQQMAPHSLTLTISSIQGQQLWQRPIQHSQQKASLQQLMHLVLMQTPQQKHQTQPLLATASSQTQSPGSMALS